MNKSYNTIIIPQKDYLCTKNSMSSMAQKDDFFFEANSVEGITEADYQRATPYVEAAQAHPWQW